MSKSLQIIIGAAPPTLTITTPAGSALPSGSVGSAYSTSLDATGGTGAQTWSVTSGALPNGVSLNPSTGAITGTPQVGSNGTHSLTVRVQDSGSPPQSAQKPLSITIGLPAPPTITTPSLPAGTVNVAYNQPVSVTGGIGTLVWGVTSGALPPGLDLNPSNGTISGTPTTSGSFNFTLRVTDAIPLFDQQNFTISISAPTPPSITTSSLPAGTVNQPYSTTQLTATGGTPPYSWSVNPPLPNGLTFNPSSGVISGTPLSGSEGNSTHQFTVTDSTIPINQEGQSTLSLTIMADGTPVTITTKSLPEGKENEPYAATLAASGGTAPYTWSVTPAFPAGLVLDPATGVISGIPIAKSDIDYAVTVQDSSNQTMTKKLKLNIK